MAFDYSIGLLVSRCNKPEGLIPGLALNCLIRALARGVPALTRDLVSTYNP